MSMEVWIASGITVFACVVLKMALRNNQRLERCLEKALEHNLKLSFENQDLWDENKMLRTELHIAKTPAEGGYRRGTDKSVGKWRGYGNQRNGGGYEQK